MNLHITGHDAVVRSSGDEIVVLQNDDERRFEIVRIEALFLHGQVEITTPALLRLADRGCQVAFLDPSGRIRARLTPAASRGLDLRRAQHHAQGDPARVLSLAREVVAAKFRGTARLLRNYRRLLGEDAAAWKDLARVPENLPRDDSLFGVEGAAARAYWALFARLLREGSGFASRKARPPADPVNSMLSYAYSILTNLVHADLVLAGLEPAQGFLHAVDESRPTLAIDLVEPLRAQGADRFVLSNWNNRVFEPADFRESSDGVYLDREARKRFLLRFHQWLHRPLRASLRPQGAPKAFSLLDAVTENRKRLAAALLRDEPLLFWPESAVEP